MSLVSREKCKSDLFKIGIKLGVSPKLISTLLLSDLDKIDMLDGLIEMSALETHVRVWMDNGMPDYVVTSKKEFPSPQIPLESIEKSQSLNWNYRKPFASHPKTA